MTTAKSCESGGIRPITGAVLLLVFACLITVLGLWENELESGDETRVAGIAAEMVIEGDYLVPHLNGEPFLEYPPLHYWMMAGAYKTFGINDFAAKFPSALMAVLCGFLVYLFARKMRYPVGFALLATIMLMTSAQFFGNSRKCMVDMSLAFFVLLAVYGFFALTQAANWRGRAGYILLFIIGCAGGIYSKGLLGLCIPVATLGGWLVLSDVAQKRVSIGRYIWLAIGVAASIAIAGIWYYLIYRRSGEMFHTAFYVNNIGRFTGSQGDHDEPFYYYLTKLPTLFVPWMIIMPFALWRFCRKTYRNYDEAMALILVFLLVPLAALTVASGKRTVYLLPLYAPCALLCAGYIWSLSEGIKQKFVAIWQRFYLGWVSAAAGYIAFIVLGVLAFGWGMLYSLLGVSMLTALILVKGRMAKLCLLLATTALLYVAIYVAIGAGQGESLRPLFERVAELEAEGKQVVMIVDSERTVGAAYFYLHHGIGEDIDPAGDAPPPGVCWLTRKRPVADSLNCELFNDSHKLITGKRSPDTE